MQPSPKRGFPFLAIAIAVAVVAALSFVPWSELTGGEIKDYNLVADLFPDQKPKVESIAEIEVDPALAAVFATDSVLSPVAAEADTLGNVVADSMYVPKIVEYDPRVDGEMVIEDYTTSGAGLANLRRALAERGKARIAVIGDSYIEGDIFTQDLRDLLQQQYGGRGVGYVPPHSQVAGFRRSVSIRDNGAWKSREIKNGNGGKYANIAGEYFTANGDKAEASFKGYAKNPRQAAWSNSSLLFVAPDSGLITLSNDVESIEYPISASEQVQWLSMPGETSTFKVQSTVPGLVFLGAWLDDDRGIGVDCMSLRGVSGMAHKNVNVPLAAQMREHVDYDLIILEYGTNVLTAEQYNYNGYSNVMIDVVSQLRKAYPHADILLLGVGDRGQKVNGELHSLPTVPYMVKAQRRAAQNAQCLFWDTREAMGGEDAIIDWRGRQLVNADYIHLNSAGGKVLAQELVNSITRMLNE